MTVVDVDGMTFTFPLNWTATKFDEWSFYRNQFVKQLDEIKAVDVIVLDPEKNLYLVEVKDYRKPGTAKPAQLAEAISRKVIYTLAAMLPAKFNANEASERKIATAALRCKSLNVVVHIEQPGGPKYIVDPADLKQKLKKMLKAIDSKPKIVSIKIMNDLQWWLVQ